MQVKDIVAQMNLGVSKKTIKGETNSPLHTLIIGIHQEVIDLLGDSINKYDISASNRLKQSIVNVDQSQEGTIKVGIKANFYWKYVQYGVNGTKKNHGSPTWGPAPAGTMSFKDSIKGWIRDRGIQARPGQTYDQMAFAIMKGIKENGIEPRPFFTDVVNKELEESIAKQIMEVYGKAIIVEIGQPWQ